MGALRVTTDKVAHVQYQHRTAAKQLRALDLAETVAVDESRTTATAWAIGTGSCRMGFQRHKGFITRHTVQRDMPEATFFFHA